MGYNMSETEDMTIHGEGNYGPAMRALPNDRVRAFVVACCTPTATGATNYTAAALAAGYGNGSRAVAQVQGSRLAHDERVQAAMLEEGQRRFGAAIPMATAIILQIMTTSTKNTDRMKAASMIFNRAGMPEKTEHSVTVQRIESREEKIERIIRIARENGLDPKTLLGNIGISLPAEKSSMLELAPAASSEGLEDFLG